MKQSGILKNDIAANGGKVSGAFLRGSLVAAYSFAALAGGLSPAEARKPSPAERHKPKDVSVQAVSPPPPATPGSFDFTRFHLRFMGLDTKRPGGVLTPLTTSGEKTHPDDPFSKTVMADFGAYAPVVRALYRQHLEDWSGLTSAAFVSSAVVQAKENAAISKASSCRVVIDPGHGYILNEGIYDPGAVQGGVSEVSPDLERLYMGVALTMAGCAVHYTRFPGYAMPLVSKAPVTNKEARIDSLIARPVFAAALGARVLLTDHYNSGGGRGEEIYCKADSPHSCHVASSMASRLGAAARSENSWRVIVNALPEMVTLYCERGYLTNGPDREKARRLSLDHGAAQAEAFRRSSILLDALRQAPIPAPIAPPAAAPASGAPAQEL